MWSLEIEIQFYLLAPFLMYVYLRQRRQAIRIAGLLVFTAAMILLAACLHEVMAFDNRYRLGLLVYGPYFLVGIAVADLSTPGSRLSRLTTGFAYDAVLLGGLSALGFLGIWFNRIDAHPQGMTANIECPLAGLVTAVLIYLGALHGRIGRKCLGTPWIALLGTMCYSIYLTHIVVIQGVSEVVLDHLSLHNRWLIWGVWLSVLALMVFACGFVFYLVVERPLMSGRRRATTVPGSPRTTPAIE
jgi:peptidoglycan/LPS O-acetylase OafA/YrhL